MCRFVLFTGVYSPVLQFKHFTVCYLNLFFVSIGHLVKFAWTNHKPLLEHKEKSVVA